jgi:hypothetical protein
MKKGKKLFTRHSSSTDTGMPLSLRRPQTFKNLYPLQMLQTDIVGNGTPNPNLDIQKKRILFAKASTCT